MRKKIVILQKSSISNYPPLLTFIKIVRQYVDVILICGNELEDNKNVYSQLCNQYYCLDIPNAKNIFGKFFTYIRIRKLFWNIIYSNKLENELLWIPTADTTIALGNRLLKHNFVLNLYELFDEVPLYQKVLKKYSKFAKLIVCAEENRANILRVWWKLSQTPVVISNKVTDIERKKNLPLTDELELIISQSKNKKIILYQGLIDPDRNLTALSEATKELDDYCLLIMGRPTDYLKKIMKINPNIIHISFLSPPYHLHITSRAHIGILTYDYSCLNNIFCAPNKIWEYSAYGIPMLGNNIPGLASVINTHKTGITVDMDNKEKIKDAINRINQNYDKYSHNSYNYYSSYNLEENLVSILKRINLWEG